MQFPTDNELIVQVTVLMSFNIIIIPPVMPQNLQVYS